MSPDALPAALATATAHQPRARVALGAALRSGPAHAYLLHGPSGSGKAEAARAFAAEILASGSQEPDSARRRALTVPSPHPDLVWLVPPGNQHLVDDVRSLLIKGAAYRPFEGERRVFCIERAEALADESQNALLKTLEEPAPFAHFILISSEPDQVLETVRSRCQSVPFGPVPVEVLQRDLAGLGTVEQVAAAARISRGDAPVARWLLSESGRELRARAEFCARAAVAGTPARAPLKDLLADAERVGAEAAAEVEAAVERDLATMPPGSREAARIRRDGTDLAKRRARRDRTAALDTALELIGLWFRDLAALGAGADAHAFNSDRLAELREDCTLVDADRAGRAVRSVADTRRRLTLNVNEELAAEALLYRL